jgi:dethiobiotin synthetase
VRDLLITGTDTGVGKTVIAAALVMALRAKGARTVGFKPVQTGSVAECESDAEVLEGAALEPGASALTAPLIQLDEPLAPAVAAERAGLTISAADIESRIEQLRRSGYSLVIEGAGGVMVPLVWGYTVLDLAERCGLGAIVVGRAGLGTLNHVTLTVAALRARGISVCGVVLNGRRDPPDLAESTNPSALSRMLPHDVIIEVPYMPRASTREVVEAVVPFIESLIT